MVCVGVGELPFKRHQPFRSGPADVLADKKGENQRCDRQDEIKGDQGIAIASALKPSQKARMDSFAQMSR